MKKLLFLPGRLRQRSRQWVARVLGPGAWLNWWQRWAPRVWPTHGPGRPRLVAASGCPPCPTIHWLPRPALRRARRRFALR